MKPGLLCITTLEVWQVKYPRWHRDFPGICFSSLSFSHERSCAKVFNSHYLPGIGPDFSKQSHQSSPTRPGSRTQWHALVTDGACTERDALIGCSTQACCKLSHKVQFVCHSPLIQMKSSKCVFLCLRAVVQGLWVEMKHITPTHIDFKFHREVTTDLIPVQCSVGCCLIPNTFFPLF